ncbi:TIGR04255 family protein [Janthinobacterium sp. HLS12-2]|uniref:TIGR04255 family protein n=1 Tax=Janthinobacterium sp. HLS12-2 TaxID=1259324 RepID=UPI003F20C15C
MNIDNLYPYAGNHAVQNAIFVVEWAEPLKTDAMIAINKLATKYKNLGLSHVQHQQMLEVNFEHMQTAAQEPRQTSRVSNQALSGIVFARPASVGEISRSVTISRKNCMIAIPDYTRWADVFKDVESYLKIALEEVGSTRPLTTIGLQYNDVFNWKDAPSELDLRAVFSEKAFIPPNAFEQTGLWHLHHGYLENHSDPVPHSRVENINVDMLDTAGERIIQIVGSHRASLREPLWQSHLKNKSVMLEVFTSLHKANKIMLGKLLTSQVCEKIRLTTD